MRCTFQSAGIFRVIPRKDRVRVCSAAESAKAGAVVSIEVAEIRARAAKRFLMSGKLRNRACDPLAARLHTVPSRR
ncbi:hypothetical protein GCM10010149_43830 [Nonomuraea roseoviolacea subsp. roseoviolacea]